jgi:tetratricopeptide (TPR) repeat protein
MRPLATLCTLAAAVLLAGCGTGAPLPDSPPPPTFDAVAAVAAIRAAGSASASELDVQPLRDSRVEDLRQQASALQARGMFRAAADLLDQALAINADDPAMLQERAEAALLLNQLPEAEAFAQRAFAAGSQVGPLCRRHWETVAQVRAGLAVSPESTVSDARRRRDACTVAAPDRF